ncbi:MAG: response regulator [Cyclobacteriaceae bacterium]
MEPKAKIAVVDDHQLFRFGITAILKSEPSFILVGEYAQAADLLKGMEVNMANIIITDLSLGKESGLDLIKKIKALHPRMRVLVMTMHKDEFHISNAVESGCDGYLYKDDKPEEVIAAVKALMNEEKYYSKDVSNILMNRIYNNPRHSTQPFLTQKEKEVVHHLMKGLSSKEIASQMNVSSRTVEAHRYNILNKFGLRSATELVKLVAEQKIQF